MSVGIRQKNNVHEFVTLTGKVNIEARNIFQSVLVKPQGYTPPPLRQRTQDARQHCRGTDPSGPVAVRGTELCCLRVIWATQGLGHFSHVTYEFPKM